jgi:hypothetical protein
LIQHLIVAATLPFIDETEKKSGATVVISLDLEISLFESTDELGKVCRCVSPSGLKRCRRHQLRPFQVFQSSHVAPSTCSPSCLVAWMESELENQIRASGHLTCTSVLRHTNSRVPDSADLSRNRQGDIRRHIPFLADSQQ